MKFKLPYSEKFWRWAKVGPQRVVRPFNEWYLDDIFASYKTIKNNVHLNHQHIKFLMLLKMFILHISNFSPFPFFILEGNALLRHVTTVNLSTPARQNF